MPSKNIVKTYVEGGHYHIYNRGVEKREIFLDEYDCKVFLYYLKMYLSPVEKLLDELEPGARAQRFIPQNLSKEVDLLSFALMPNHIHLQIKQNTKYGIIKFMRRLITSYVMYFNKKYKRIGPLFQNAYKAVFIESDFQLLHLSRYIHLNSFDVRSKINFSDFSSYPYYLSNKEASWLKPQEILNYFKEAKNLGSINSYKSFVENYKDDLEKIEGLTLEEI